MDMLFLSILIISILMFLILGWRKANPTKSHVNLPPGPWKFPFTGNMHNFLSSLPHHALQCLSTTYGPVMHLQIGELSIVVISSPDAAKQVMKTHDINFASRPPIIAAQIASYSCTSIAFAPYGDYWRQLRKICSLELLSMKRIHSFRPIRERVTADLIRSIATCRGTTVNLTEEIQYSTYSTVSRSALGESTKERQALLPLFKELVSLASGFNIGDLYPSIKLVQAMSGMRPKLERLHREIDIILEGIVRERRLATSTSASGQDQEATEIKRLVDVLLGFQDDGVKIPLTTDNIKSVLLDILAGATETSGTTIDWAMAEMMRNPEILQKAQDEVRQAFDTKGYIDESCIHELKYLECIVKETLRLHTPVPLLLPRKCDQKCEVLGYDIPAGTRVVVNAWAICRDPKYWENAECFDPERFLDTSVDFRGDSFEYIPFGAGRRMCPGLSYGLSSVNLLLTTLLYHFDWKLPVGMKSEEVDMTEGPGANARRKYDLHLVPTIKVPIPG